MYFFTSDEHYGHTNIIKFCNRPYSNVLEMDRDLIARHNAIVGNNDIVIHAGDFCFRNKLSANSYIESLNGQHIFLKGSHDKWLKNNPYIWEGKIDQRYIVVCHYAMLTWPRSHYGSWQLFGHSHGNLEINNKAQYDIGVDNNCFSPLSFNHLCAILEGIKL